MAARESALGGGAQGEGMLKERLSGERVDRFRRFHGSESSPGRAAMVSAGSGRASRGVTPFLRTWAEIELLQS